MGERTVWNSPRDTARALTIFGQAGTGDPRLNAIGAYTGAGVALNAPFAGRDADVAGIGVAVAYNGGRFRTQQRVAGVAVAREEVALELSYLAQVVS